MQDNAVQAPYAGSFLLRPPDLTFKFGSYFILFSLATGAESPQQREAVTVGPYPSHPVNVPCGMKPEYPEKTHDFRQSVDYNVLLSHENWAQFHLTEIELGTLEVKGEWSDQYASDKK